MRDDFYLPPEYLFLPPDEATRRILAHKRRLGRDLTLLAHSYQRPEVQEIADVVGDGLTLARHAATTCSRFVLAATVRYAADNALLLGPEDRRVIAVDREAGCPMSDGVAIEALDSAVAVIEQTTGQRVTPIASLTSSIELKAWTGEHGGWTCASSNATTALARSREQRACALFFPDQHLGRAAAHALDLDPMAMLIWNPGAPLEPSRLRGVEVVIVAGECHVHGSFRESQLRRAREKHPGAMVLAHRDAPREVTISADVVGGEQELKRAIEIAPTCTPIVVASEVHFVERLRRLHPQHELIELETSFCPTMYMVHLAAVLHALDHLDDADTCLTVPESLRDPARAALQRMLDLS